MYFTTFLLDAREHSANLWNFSFPTLKSKAQYLFYFLPCDADMIRHRVCKPCHKRWKRNALSNISINNGLYFYSDEAKRRLESRSSQGMSFCIFGLNRLSILSFFALDRVSIFFNQFCSSTQAPGQTVGWCSSVSLAFIVVLTQGIFSWTINSLRVCSTN